MNVKVELNCPTRGGISRVEINTPQNLDHATSGLCGNTFLNDGMSCSLHYVNEKGDTVCSDSSEILGNEWRVKTNLIDWKLDLQVGNFKNIVNHYLGAISSG